MKNITINHFAVWVCSLINLVLGALWYSPILFKKCWLHETGLNEEILTKQNPAKTIGLTFFLSLLMSYNLAFFLGDAKTTPKWGLIAGMLAGFGWATLSLTIIALFEQRSWRYIAINGGFITIYFSIIGLILGTWR